MCPQEVADKRQVATAASGVPHGPSSERPDSAVGAPESSASVGHTTTAAPARGAASPSREQLEDVKLRSSSKIQEEQEEEEEEEKEVSEKPRAAHNRHATRPEEAQHHHNSSGANKLPEPTRNKTMLNKTSRTQRKLVTNLVSAANEGKLELVRLLLRCGADVNGQDDELGNTALHQAAWNGFSETVQLLCRHRANTSIRNKAQFTPLHMACQQGHNQSARLLLMANSKTEAKNSYGDTPLHTAARYGHAGVARILLSAKSNPNQVNKNHDTPLHIAAAMGRRKLTKIFMQHGAEPAIKNKQGETAMDIALRKDLIDIQELIANPPALKASSSSSSSLRRRLASSGATAGSCGQLYGSARNRLHTQPAHHRHSKVLHNDVRVSSEDAISSELEHRLGQLAVRSKTCRAPPALAPASPPNEVGASSSQYSLQHHNGEASGKLQCNGSGAGTRAQPSTKCRLRCKTLTSAADLHLLMADPPAANGATRRPNASGGGGGGKELSGQRRIRGGSGGDLLPGCATINGAAGDQLAPDARSPLPPNEWPGRPFAASAAAAHHGSMAPVACKEEAGGKKSASPAASLRSCSTASGRSCGGPSRRHHKTSLLVRRPNAMGTCVARLLLLKPKHQLLRQGLAASQASHDRQADGRAATPGGQKQQACAQDKPLAGRRQERLDKMHHHLSSAAAEGALQQVARAPNGARLQATRPLAALSDETQLYAVPKKSKAKQLQVSGSHDTSTPGCTNHTPSPHQLRDEAGQQPVRAGSDGPALTSDGCASLTDSAGGSYDALSLAGAESPTKTSDGHDLDSRPCLCSAEGPFETEQGHPSAAQQQQQVAGTTGQASIFHLGAVTRNSCKPRASDEADAAGANELVRRQIPEKEGSPFASSPAFERSTSPPVGQAAKHGGAEKQQQPANDKKPGKRSFWLKSRFSLARSSAATQSLKSAKGALKVAANNGRAKVEPSQLDALKEPAGAHEERIPEQLIQITKKQHPKAKATEDCQLAKPKSSLLSSGSAELIAAQRSLAAAAAAKVKRDRLTRLVAAASAAATVDQQQQQTTTKGSTQEQAAAPATSVPNLSHGVLTVKTAGDSFGWPVSGTLNQTGLNQKYLLAASGANGQSHRSGSNSVGMSDSSPSNNGADSDNSLHTTTGSLNTDNTSGEHQPPNSTSPLGILSRILLNNKNYTNLMQQVPASSPSSSNSASPSTVQNGAAKKLEQLVSRSRQPIVVAKSNELQPSDAGATSSQAGPPLPSKSSLKPASNRWQQRPSPMISNISGDHMNGLPRVSSYTHISSSDPQPKHCPQQQHTPYKNLCGFHSSAHTQPGYFAHFHFRSPYSDRLDSSNQQQHHISHHDLRTLAATELSLPASAVNYEYYLNGGPSEVPLVSSLYQPAYHYNCAPTDHQQLQSQYTLHNNHDDSIYIPAYTLHESSQHRDGQLSVPEPELITARLSATCLKQQLPRPKSSIDSVLQPGARSISSPLFYNQLPNGQHRQFSANYYNSPSSMGAHTDAASAATTTTGSMAPPAEGGAGGQLSGRHIQLGAGSKVNELNLDSYITDVPASHAHSSAKIPPAYYHGVSSASGACLSGPPDTMSKVPQQTVGPSGGGGGLPTSFLYSTENSIYAANQAASRQGSDLTVLPTAADSSSYKQQQYQAAVPPTTSSPTGGQLQLGNSDSPRDCAAAELQANGGAGSPGGLLEVKPTAAKLHKSLVQVNQSTPTGLQAAKSNQSCGPPGQQLSPPTSDCSHPPSGPVTGVGQDLQGADAGAIHDSSSSHATATPAGVNNVNRSSRIQNKLPTTSMRAGHTKLIISSGGMQLGTSVKMGDDKLIKEHCLGLESTIKGSCSGSAVI